MDCDVLKGHRGSVVCFDRADSSPSHSSPLLISGSDDFSVRIWDLRTNRACKCFVDKTTSGDEDIQGVHFLSPITTNSIDSSNYVMVVRSNSILMYDLRSEGVIIQQPFLNFLPENAKDFIVGDINTSSYVHSNCMLALADDSSDIHVVKLDTNNLITGDASSIEGGKWHHLTNVHTSSVSSIAFSSKGKDELISGSFDCKLCKWDLNRKTPMKSYQFQNIDSALSETTATSQVVNPPFVHTVSYLPDSDCSVVGLGDGTIRLLNHELKLMDEKEAHGGMITSLVAMRNLVFAGGIDERITCFQMETTGKSKKKTNYDCMVQQWQLNHNKKVNVLYPLVDENQLAVGDVSNDIYLYHLR